MTEFERIEAPREGERIGVRDGKLSFPDNPVIPFIEGDGIGPDITRAMLKVSLSPIFSAVSFGRK